ncbi:hypothetical protein WIS52_01380 [Pseudonocardia nematodicida]|uniref:N-acetyltransferase domain-containing protein n=1 Tax=Pseudonocardia nematodicida TaxID=1206997 RepID=A0ABV1K3S2_9PSEU
MNGRVREYRVADADAVIGLHRRTLLAGHEPEPDFAAYLTAFYGATLFDHPWVADDLTSSVFEDADGAVVGFVGVIPRPMVLDDRPLRAAVSVRFMVDPDHPHGPLAAAALHRRFLRGPQDLSLVENANDAARRVWQASRQADVLTTGSISWSVPGSATAGTGPVTELDPGVLLDLLLGAAARYRLRPHYDEKSLTWLLDHLTGAGYRGTLHAHAVYTRDGRPAGWYVYYRRPADRPGYHGVLQLVWDRDPGPVLEALRAHAGGSDLPIHGRLQDGLLPHLAAHGGTLSAGPWTVVHSPDPRIRAAFRAGDAFLTRFEGEFC